MLASQSLPDTDSRDPGKVLTRLNDVFPMEKQDGKYFTIWYGVFNRVRRTLAYSNAGHPPALLYSGLSAADARRHELKSVGMAAGMIEGTTYETQEVELGPCARLLLYSDGVYEIARPDGTMWTLQEFVHFVSALPSDGLTADSLLNEVRQMRGSGTLVDDFSFLEIRL
jgi:sigma-B regulation protein RsbU (phosphoserine phosphatase)